jgi:hypothetical protein
MTYIPEPSPSFGSKERMKDYFSDALAEVPENYNPHEVADAFLEELESWITYHADCKATYESVRIALRKRVSET